MRLLGSVLMGLNVIAADEVMVALPGGGGQVGLSTRGPTAFRVRFLFNSTLPPIDTPMVMPDEPDAVFTKTTTNGTGITASFGSVVITTDGRLVLTDAQNAVLTTSAPLGNIAPPDICSTQEADVGSADRVADPKTVDDAPACCDACKAVSDCTNWIYGHPGDAEGNCWLLKNIAGVHSSDTRTLGGAALGGAVALSTTAAGLYGRGAGPGDCEEITATSVTAHVENRETYVPYYYSTDGYSALGVVAESTGNGKTNYFEANYNTNGKMISWSSGKQDLELYLMPAATLDQGTAAYYTLTGRARVPPRYAFGFIASRWGWQDRAYIEDVLHHFRDGKYPIDAFITDFGWFTNVSDYDFSPDGQDWYADFDFSAATFPDPAAQLASYHTDLNFHMGGIRKPRLGNSDLLKMAESKGWLFEGGEFDEHLLTYADHRNINYSIPEARQWYIEQQSHYIDAGVDFFWNDEGETDFFTFYWWNIAQRDTWQLTKADQRFFSINRAWTPGMARLGATVWTGDVNPSWDDLRKTPGMVVNWGLGGAPYVACDIGGFTSQTQPDLLTRWYQVGVFMPVMRVHSTKDATPHFPWLWDPQFESAMQLALNLRYQLIPYHYSLAHHMFTTGKLWMRALAAGFPTDDSAAKLTTQWLDGDLLVAPVLSQDSNKNVYLPEGMWYTFNTATVTKGPTTITGSADLAEIPVFARAGAVVPLAPVIQYSDALPGGPLNVHVYAGTDGAFTLVEDDGRSIAYESGKGVRRTALTWTDASMTLSWTVTGDATVPNGFEQIFVSYFSADGSKQTDAQPLASSGSIVVA